MLVRQSPRLDQKRIRAVIDTTLSEQRLDQDRAGEVIDGTPQRGCIVSLHERHTREPRIEVRPVLLLPRHRERPIGPPVVGVPQRHNPVLAFAPGPPPETPRQLQRTLDCLRAAGREERPRHPREPAKPLRQQAHVAVAVLRREVDHPGRLIRHGGDHPRMRMSERVHPQPAHHIQIPVPILVEEVHPLASLHYHRIPRVHRQKPLLVPAKHPPCLQALPE